MYRRLETDLPSNRIPQPPQCSWFCASSVIAISCGVLWGDYRSDNYLFDVCCKICAFSVSASYRCVLLPNNSCERTDYNIEVEIAEANLFLGRCSLLKDNISKGYRIKSIKKVPSVQLLFLASWDQQLEEVQTRNCLEHMKQTSLLLVH